MKHHETSWNIMKQHETSWNYSPTTAILCYLHQFLINYSFIIRSIRSMDDLRRSGPLAFKPSGISRYSLAMAAMAMAMALATDHSKSSPQIRFLKDLENLWTGSLWENRERIAYRIKNAQHFKSIRCRNPICPLWARSLLRSAKLLWSTEHVVSAGSPIEYCGMYTVSVSGQM